MPVFVTNRYVKKCFSRDFLKILLLFWRKSLAKITNRKLGGVGENRHTIFVHKKEEVSILTHPLFTLSLVGY